MEVLFLGASARLNASSCPARIGHVEHGHPFALPVELSRHFKKVLASDCHCGVTVSGPPPYQPDRPGIGGGGEGDSPGGLSAVESGEVLSLPPDKNSELPDAGHPGGGGAVPSRPEGPLPIAGHVRPLRQCVA